MASEADITLGEFLRHERERRGITIEQVASATKVGVRTLHALEADHYSELPAKPFIRGFVTSYARFIGLDAKEILSRFDEFINKKSIERPNRESGHSGYAFEKKDGEQQSRTILMIAVFSFIAFGGAAMLVLKPSLRHRHSSHLEKLRAAHGNGEKKEPGGESVQPSPSPSISPSPSPSPPPPPSSSEVREEAKAPTPEETEKQAAAGSNPKDPLDSGLTLPSEEIRHKATFHILADIWVRYQVDQRPTRKFIIRKGRSLVLRAKDSIRFQCSNPNSLKFSYNGHGFETFSHSKKVVVRQGDATLYFPAELSEKIPNPFGDDSPLEKTPDPESDQKTPEVTPSSEASP